MLVAIWAAGLAEAKDDLTFAPDRPGIGDSTSSPGRGRAIAQLGLLTTVGPSGGARLSTSAWMLRAGVDEGVELRLRLPDLGMGEGSLAVGTTGVGALVGGRLGERWSSSVVPELFVDPSTGQVGASLNGNIAVALGDAGLWLHGSASGTRGTVGTLAGGGASWSFGEAGAYVNAWRTFDEATTAGGGFWWLVSDRAQVDLGLDVSALDDGGSQALVGGGLSLGI